MHDDGRARLTRSGQRFDVIQMSLVDTWAATGAGAFTLSENGLYTLDAWRVFLSRLSPGGVLSVSRWFNPDNTSETSRLVGLGVASLIDRGVARPGDQLVLLVSGRVATLMVSSAPFTTTDRDRLDALANERGFEIAVAPWRPAGGQPPRPHQPEPHRRRAPGCDRGPALRLLPTDRSSSVLLQHAASARAVRLGPAVAVRRARRQPPGHAAAPDAHGHLHALRARHHRLAARGARDGRRCRGPNSVWRWPTSRRSDSATC